jgi:hypothetical protein
MPVTKKWTDETVRTEQQIQAAAESPEEVLLRQLALGIYRSIAGGLRGGDLFGLGPSQDLLSLAAQAERTSLGAAREEMGGVFEDFQRQTAAEMANRGLLGSSNYGRALGIGQRELLRQYASLAARAQAGTAEQIYQGSTANRAARLQMAQWAANPQLLRDLTELRLRTARVLGTTRTTGYAKTEEPYDWLSFFASLGQTMGQAAL